MIVEAALVRRHEWPLVVFGLWCGVMWTGASTYWLIMANQPISVSSPSDLLYVLALGPGIAMAWIGEQANRSAAPIFELAVLAEVLAIGFAIAALTIYLLRRSGA